ncbi:MAG: [LysW]-lysine hydrolase [Chloroflexi bacterium]|nr:[LysW]-lysine hydrolase [Chloroflexota bacterium]MCL5274203.1 [LysW]-lysine hydrolase [Chloroflexota bacterium]
MIELLEACVRIRSLSGQEQVVAEFLRDQMNARGFHAHVDPAGNAVGVIGAGPRQLVMLGHMDTVDGIVPVRYENGALYGRGAVDAKGPLCAFILAAAHVGAASPELLEQWQIIVIGATEEEAASSKGARYAMTQYRPQFCIIGEPSGSDGITLGYKGRLLTYARFEQPSQHTAMPGPSPAVQAIRLWNTLDEFTQRYNADKPRAFDQVLPTLRKISSDDDGLLAWCDMLISLRLPLEMGPQQMQEQFEVWCRTDRCAAARLTFNGHEHAYRSSRETPLARAFVDAIRAEHGRPAFKMKTGTADFNVVGPVWQCPIVAYGPGDSSLDHTPDEHVDIAEFERSVHILERVLRDVIRSQS